MSHLQRGMCELAKLHHISFSKSKYTPFKLFTIIHSDLWGPCRNPNYIHTRWFITFIDDHTCVCWAYLLKDKIDIWMMFINFYAMIQIQFQIQIQIFCTDNSIEYVNNFLKYYLQNHGIIHQTLCVYTQQNGVVERKNTPFESYTCPNVHQYTKNVLERCCVNICVSHK